MPWPSLRIYHIINIKEHLLYPSNPVYNHYHPVHEPQTQQEYHRPHPRQVPIVVVVLFVEPSLANRQKQIPPGNICKTYHPHIHHQQGRSLYHPSNPITSHTLISPPISSVQGRVYTIIEKVLSLE